MVLHPCWPVCVLLHSLLLTLTCTHHVRTTAGRCCRHGWSRWLRSLNQWTFLQAYWMEKLPEWCGHPRSLLSPTLCMLHAWVMCAQGIHQMLELS